jgi:hypothetical protein
MFKLICLKCGKELTIEQDKVHNDRAVFSNKDINIFTFNGDCGYYIECDCGNRVEDYR